MTSPEYLFITGIVWALLIANALHSIRHFAPLVVPSFFAAWLPLELPLHTAVVLILSIAVPIATGGVQGWHGWSGLALSITALAGLWFLHTQGRNSHKVVEAALATAFPETAESHHRQRPAATGGTIPVPPGGLMRPFRFSKPTVKVECDIPYHPDNHPRHRLDIYRHRDSIQKAPVLLQIHGGGWAIGHKAQQALPLLHSMAAEGWLCVSINYRLSPKARWPDHLIDVKRALAWIKAEIASYGGDPDFIVVTGGSAGGHLAAMAALTAGQPRWQPGFDDADTSVQGAVICYGVYDLVEKHHLWCYRGWHWFMQRLILPSKLADPEAMLDEASPLSWVGPQAPPFMIIHGGNDSLICVRQARAFVAALRAKSTQAVVYAELPYAQHAFDMFWSPRALAVVRGIHRFGESLRLTRGHKLTTRQKQK